LSRAIDARDVALVDVWFLDDLDEQTSDERTLSADELARAARFRLRRDRERFIRSRATLRSLLAAYGGQAPKDIRLESAPGGKPFAPEIPSIHFSLSHCSTAAAYAVSFDTEVGIDIEEARTVWELERLVGSICTPNEQMLLRSLPAADQEREVLRYWVCKEALLKAAGEGISFGLARAHVAMDGLSPFPELDDRPGPWCLRMVEVHRSLITAVAARSRDLKLHVRRVRDARPIPPSKNL
jgi:4'-phosphopantetheinyl transferase